MVKRLSRKEHQAFRLPSDHTMAAVLWDGLHEDGLEKDPAADKMARTLVGLAIQADRVESNRAWLGRVFERYGLIHGEREKRLRRDGGVVVRAVVDGKLALLDRRSSVFGVDVLVGGVDDEGRFGVTFRRSGHDSVLDDPINLVADFGDRVIGEPTQRIDRSFKPNGSFGPEVSARLGALTSALQSPNAVIAVDIISPDPRSYGLSPSTVAEHSIGYHLPSVQPMTVVAPR